MIYDVTSSAINKHTPTLRGRSDTHVENQVTKPSRETSLTNEASQRIVNDKLIEKLDKVLQKNGSESVRNLDYSDYTPEAVSSRILNFVQEAINRAGTRGENQNQLMEQAKAGISRGFEDAENILTSLNALSGAIAENVQKTYELIQNGLNDVANQIGGNASNGSTKLAASNYSSSTHTSSQSLELNIQTHDGDNLKLSLSRDEHTGQYSAQIKNPNGDARYDEQTYSLDSNFSLSVTGSLDEDEAAAVEELLVGIKGVADEFFAGNSEAALEAGLNLGYDSSEIASFSLSLNENQTTSVTQAYEEVSQIGRGSNHLNRESLQNLLKPVQGFITSLHSAIENAEKTGLFNDPKSNVIDMLEYFSKSNEKNAATVEKLEEKAGVPFHSITNSLIS